MGCARKIAAIARSRRWSILGGSILGLGRIGLESGQRRLCLDLALELGSLGDECAKLVELHLGHFAGTKFRSACANLLQPLQELVHRNRSPV